MWCFDGTNAAGTSKIHDVFCIRFSRKYIWIVSRCWNHLWLRFTGLGFWRKIWVIWSFPRHGTHLCCSFRFFYFLLPFFLDRKDGFFYLVLRKSDPGCRICNSTSSDILCWPPLPPRHPRTAPGTSPFYLFILLRIIWVFRSIVYSIWMIRRSCRLMLVYIKRFSLLAIRSSH